MPAPLEPGQEDATRRTRLASERTYLAWWRSGLTSFAVAFGVGALLPQLSEETDAFFRVVGVAFAVLGIGAIAYGYVRRRAVEAALDRGEFARMDDRAALALALAGAVLGVLAVVLIAVGAD